MITRRRFTLTAGGALASMAFGEACLVATRTADAEVRLTARPRPQPPDRAVVTTLQSGPIGMPRGDRDGVIQMPSAPAKGKLPLLLFLHGATQRGAGMLRRIGPAADAAGVVVVAPDSADVTWDAIRDGFGEDVAHLNKVLDYVFAHVDVDPVRIALGGFSDGATYAISLGIANGDLFPRIAAFSPGFVIRAAAHGRPRFFISHGRSDQILPIDQCSRIIVPQLREAGYTVTFREFDGRHEMPADVAAEGLRWIAAS